MIETASKSYLENLNPYHSQEFLQFLFTVVQSRVLYVRDRN